MTHIQVLRPDDSNLAEQLRRLAGQSIPRDLGDDRFDEGWEHKLQQAGERFIAAGLRDDEDELVAYIGGIIEDGQLHLDALVQMEHREPRAAMDQLLTILAPELPENSKGPDQDIDVYLWAKPSFAWHQESTDSEEGSPSNMVSLAALQMHPHRALHQMRAPMAHLLAGSKPLPTRAFTAGVDDEALRRLNNRSFAHHPDQGGQGAAQFRADLNQEWVNPEGIRLHEVDGRLVGFCWTKIHQNPLLGEIYVIGIDPDFHGQGLGGPMTTSGLQWLNQQGLETAMLYVEANNAPALATYERLGFSVVRTDQSWRWVTLR